MGNIVTINSNAWRLPFNFKILFLQAEKLSEFLFKRWWFLGNDLTLIREGTKRSCLYILLYYCLVTLVTFPNIYLGLIFWILFFKIRTGFCSASTFSWPGVTFFLYVFCWNSEYILDDTGCIWTFDPQVVQCQKSPGLLELKRWEGFLYQHQG